MKYYYASANNQTTGPVERSELDRLAREGVISAATAVIPEGSQTWTTYGQLQQDAAVSAAASAIAAGVSTATAALRTFSWGSFLFGLLLAVLNCLTLPARVLTGAARELAQWGRERTLPLATSDVPVLTYLVIVLRNVTLVVTFAVVTLLAVLALFGAGPLYRYGGYGYGGWNAWAAFGGFLGGMLAAYFGSLLIALWFELLSITVRIANDVKRIAQR
jgi:hypothetical protein